jgi:hypothetical protein
MHERRRSRTKAKFCEWFQHVVRKDKEFVSKIAWSDEATLNRHNCVHWVPENPRIHVDKAVKLPGLSGVDCRTGV